MSFNRAILRAYAQHTSPSTLPPTVYFAHTDDTITIFDAYPKAMFHFLVLPRISEEPYTASNLTSLKKFLASSQVGKERAEELIRKLKDVAENVKGEIEEEMIERFGFKWQVNMGFHAVQSMDHIHLHVISDDLCSPGLKTKKHYNSFRPNLGFFLHIKDVLSWFESDRTEPFFQSMIKLDEASYEKKLKEPLECFKCGKELRNMPLLKMHLQEHFDQVAKVFANRATSPSDAEKQVSNRKRKEETVDESSNEGRSSVATKRAVDVTSKQPASKKRKISPVEESQEDN